MKGIPRNNALLTMTKAGVAFAVRMAIHKAAATSGVVTPSVLARALTKAKPPKDDDDDDDIELDEDDDRLTDEEKREREKKLQKNKKDADKGRKAVKRKTAKKNDDDDDDDDDKEDDVKNKSLEKQMAAFDGIEVRIDRIEREKGLGAHAVDEKLRAICNFAVGRNTKASKPADAFDEVTNPADLEIDARLMSAVDNSMDADHHAQKMLVKVQKKLMRAGKARVA